MSGGGTPVILDTLCLASALVALAWSSHEAGNASIQMLQPWTSLLSKRVPLAEVSVILAGLLMGAVPTYAFGFTLGLVMSNMVATSVLAMSRVKTATYATFPLCIASALCLLALGLGFLASVTGRANIYVLIMDNLVLFLILTYTVTLPLWRTTKGLAECRTSNLCSGATGEVATSIEPSISADEPDHNVSPLGTNALVTETPSGISSARLENEPDVARALESQPLLPVTNRSQLRSEAPLRRSFTPVIYTALIVTAAFAVSWSAHRLVTHSLLCEVQPGIWAGFIIATCRILPLLRPLWRQEPSDRVDCARAICTNNLLLLALGMSFASFSPPFLFGLVLTALSHVAVAIFAAVGIWSPSNVWVGGIVPLILATLLSALEAAIRMAFERPPRNGEIPRCF